MKFDNQNRQAWNRGFSRLWPPEGSTPASHYRIWSSNFIRWGI